MKHEMIKDKEGDYSPSAPQNACVTTKDYDSEGRFLMFNFIVLQN